jgi:hypothetical protein
MSLLGQVLAQPLSCAGRVGDFHRIFSSVFVGPNLKIDAVSLRMRNQKNPVFGSGPLAPDDPFSTARGTQRGHTPYAARGREPGFLYAAALGDVGGPVRRTGANRKGNSGNSVRSRDGWTSDGAWTCRHPGEGS